jgi:ribonuclease-3
MKGTATRTQRDSDLVRLQKKLGLTFKDVALLEQALSHRSYCHETPGAQSNERLEFLGDAVLGCAVASTLCELFPDLPEGQLTQIKAAAVSEVSLNKVARELDLGRYVKLSKGEGQAGGRERPSILADAVEAIIGAVHLDRGACCARKLVDRLLGKTLERLGQQEAPTDYKTMLQEVIQGEHKCPPAYYLAEQSGPDHDKSFVMEVRFGGQVLGVGRGKSKKEAEQAAARAALMRAHRISCRGM